MEKNQMDCKNCGNKFEGNFCNNCGQRSTVDRIDWKYLINSISENFLQINKGFIYTAKALLLKPKESLMDFFIGKRKPFFKPLTFLIVSATILLISTKIFENATFVDDFIGGFKEATENNDRASFKTKPIDFFIKNQTYAFLLTVPLFSIASFIGFRKANYNFAEHLILNLFITGEQLLFYSLFSFITDRNSPLTIIPLVIGFIYNIWVYNKLFNDINYLKRNFILLITYLIYLTLLCVLLLLILQILRITTL